MAQNITIVKLGGSIITDKTKPYTPNLPNIKSLALEIKKADKSVVIVHGQGSFAHTSAKKYGGKKGYKSLIGVATVFRDAMEMNRIFMDVLLKTGLPAISFRPNSLFLAKDGKMKSHNLEPVLMALHQGLIPVLYGDVIMDTLWKTTIFSGETSTAYLVKFLQSKKVKVDKIIQVGITDGVYSIDKRTIPIVNQKNYLEIKKNIFKSTNTDVTGGMQHKVEEALKVAKKGVKTYIISGNKKNNLYHVLSGKTSIGTVIQ